MKPFARIILVLTLVFAAAAEVKLAPTKLEDYTHGDIVTVMVGGKRGAIHSFHNQYFRH
jgi:hypothetical protein